jgi:hypothetical protein
VIHVVFGPALEPDEISRLDDAALIAEVEGRIRECHKRARMGREQARIR